MQTCFINLRERVSCSGAICLAMLAAFGLAVGACGDVDADEARTMWLRHALLEENRVLIEREPRFASEKFLLMASDPYRFFRGTAGLFVRDTHAPGGALVLPTRYGSAEGATIRLVGDPHPENIGSFRRGDGTMTVAWNDFDASTWGPWTHDLRRLGVALWVASYVADPNREDTDRALIVAAMVNAYADRVAQAEADVGFDAPAPDDGTIINDLLRRALRDGDAREELDEYTQIVDGQRRMFFGEVEPADGPWVGDFVGELDLDEVVRLEAAILDWRTRAPDAGQTLGWSRRYGAGISSYPVARYYVLFDGAEATPDDDFLLEFKEVLDPLMFPNSNRRQDRAFRCNGERVANAQLSLQQEAGLDEWLGWAQVGAQSFRSRQRTKYQKNFDVVRLVEKLAVGEWNWDDWAEFGATLGSLLAEAHLRSTTLTGQSGLDVVAADIAGDAAGLVTETVAFTTEAGALLLSDFDALQEIIAAHGPLLGYRRNQELR